DSLGRRVSTTQGPRTTAFAYDAQGNLASVTDALGRSIVFGYDSVGRLMQQILPDNREIAYSYDANGNLTSITPPGRPRHMFNYTAVDLEESYTPPAVSAESPLTRYFYNLDRQLVHVARPDGTPIDLDYDSAGRLSTITHPRGQMALSYHLTTGNLASIADPNSGTVAYAYDGSLLTHETWTGTISG